MVRAPGALRTTGEDGRAERVALVGLVFELAHGLDRALAPGHGCELGVGGQSFEILERLARAPDHRLRMSDLAAQTGLTPSGLTRAIDRLVAAELVERLSCPSDRRGAFAALSERGRVRTVEALARHARDVERVLGDALAPEEERALASLLRRLRDRVHRFAAPQDQDGAPSETACPTTEVNDAPLSR